MSDQGPGTGPLVSVVTPVFNTEGYIEECIESVLAQTYSNWDYTIVNNCSTDRSLERAERFASLDPRIRIVTNDAHLGQVANLNRALSFASPDSVYCKMVLADDWIFPRCLEEMVALGEANRNVGIIGSYRLDESQVNCDGVPYPSNVMTGREVCRLRLIDNVFLFGSPNTLMFRSDVVRERNPFYDEERLHEDTEACFEILHDHDFGFVHQVLSFTRRQNESLTAERRVFDPHHLLDWYILALRFGPEFLGPDEARQCEAEVGDLYYRFLAVSSLGRQDAEFWSYHRHGLSTAGAELDRHRLNRARLAALGREFSHPVGLARKVLARCLRVCGIRRETGDGSRKKQESG